MSECVESVVVVSDGILVRFGNGVNCYYPASFLLEHLDAGPNQVFLDYDPSGDSKHRGFSSLAVA